ncbi:MAG: TonB-dependent receptor [Bacteroidetes bacterium]|nr:TonB-dependent receptor [Bacteroidota bacterium]
MNSIRFFFTFCMFMFFSLSYSQDTIQDTTKSRNVDELFKLDLDEFLKVVITPSKHPQSGNIVTQMVDVIVTKEIETNVSGNRNLCEVISNLPGASITVLSRNDANWGTYGGIGPKYSTYMLQGLPLDAFMDPMSLDLNIIDHIEVQRGPASVIYPNFLSQDFAGIQSPLAGTVNLILKSKIEHPKTALQLSYGSYNTLNGQILHQNRLGRLNYFCGVSYEMSEYTNYGTEGSWLNMQKDPQYRKTKLYGGLTLFIDKAEKQKVTFFFQKTWHAGDAGRVYRGYDNRYGTINAGYEVTFSEKLQLQSHLGIRSYDRSWQESNFGVIDTLKSNNGVNQLIIPADLSLAWIQGKKGALTVGADYQGATYYTWSDPLLGYRLYGSKSSATQYGVYIQEDWYPLSKLVFRAGLRYSWVSNQIALVNAQAPVDSKYSWNRLLWSVGIRYLISDKFSLYANGGSSFAPPGLKSTNGTILLSDFKVPGKNGQLPNPGLKPENGIGTDLGFEGKLPAHLKLGVRFFYIVLQDAIVDNVVSQNPSQSQSINTRSTSLGGELEISQKILPSLDWFANITYMKTNIKNDSSENQNNVEVPFSPNIVANIGLNYSAPFGLTVVPALNYNGGFYDGTSITSRTWFTPGFVFNAYLAQVIAKGDIYRLECFLQFYNITNNKCILPWQFQNPGFSMMCGLKLTFL